MRIRTAIVLSLLLFASAALGQTHERWILISGTVGVFHTDARVFNPSFEKDIQITARFFPAGPQPTDNSGAAAAPGTTFTIPKRTMHVLNDVTTALFNTASLGAIQLTSADPFEATSRIYAESANGTLGQFGPGLPVSQAKMKGAILQMKQNGVRGQTGTFRTNIGLLNPGATAADVSWRLYDRTSALVGTGDFTVPPYGATTPILMNSTFFWDQLQQAADLSDAWVSFTSTVPIFAYGSVLDNGTDDQTFIAAVDDVGVAPSSPPPQPQPTTHTFDVTLEDFSITFSPAPSGIQVGDTVRLRIRRRNGSHGFQLNSPSGVAVPNMTAGTSPVERTFTVTQAGQYDYFCTVSSCGEGHFAMTGSFRVDGDGGTGQGPGY